MAMSLLLLAPAAPASLLPDYSAERQRYQQGIMALRMGSDRIYRQVYRDLHDYPLLPYLHYADLRRRLDTAHTEEVRLFLEQYAELPVADQLRRRWLRELGKARRWTDYLTDYTPQAAADLRCYWHRARLQRRQPANYDPKTRDLWLIGESQNDACDPLFEHWRNSGQLDQQAYAQRAELAAQAGQDKLVRYLVRGLPGWRRAEIERWLAFRSRPERELTRAATWEDTPFHRRLLEVELKRLARRSNELANREWPALSKTFSWSADQQAAIERELALYYATDYPSDALDRLQNLPRAAQDRQILEWTIRVAVHDGQWQAVLDTYDKLPPAAGDDARWRYWQARAMAEIGRSAEAAPLFATLATEANYYGFLSADRLSQPYALCPKPVSDVDTASLTANPRLLRALELQRVGQLTDARREWSWLLRTLTPDQRLNAAQIIADHGWYNSAIITLANEGALTAYETRFPLAFSTIVTERAKHESLDPSLVFAIARAESALMTDAVSSAGARGLMQVTLPTGRRVAKAHGWRRPSNWDLLQPKTNIRLGAAYVDELFGRFDHPLLVLGAYNAGPHVIDRWLTMGFPTEPDRWVESLPYHETRDYIARVLAFATIYDWRRNGVMGRLNERMPAMDQRPGRVTPSAAKAKPPVCAMASVAQR